MTDYKSVWSNVNQKKKKLNQAYQNGDVYLMKGLKVVGIFKFISY